MLNKLSLKKIPIPKNDAGPGMAVVVVSNPIGGGIRESSVRYDDSKVRVIAFRVLYEILNRSSID
jgi:hypothetical protein